MNLAQLRAEVLSKGFDPGMFNARITQYLNDAQNLVARRVDYYVDEATYTFATVNGTANYAWPATLARMRSLSDTDRRLELQDTTIRTMDRSYKTTGAPLYYAVTGSGVQLWPTPDGVYNLQMRYWAMPTALVNDADVPSIPADWHQLLWNWATARCYESEDDAQMGQFWQARFDNLLSMFAADQKFPDTDGPHQAKGMWEQEDTLSVGNQWTYYQ